MHTYSRANVSYVLTCSRAKVLYMLTCSRANVPCMLTCSRPNVPCVLTCSRTKVSCVLMCSRSNVPCVLTCSRPVPDDLKSLLVYKFTCASCSSSYIGETCRHFKTRFEEHIIKDNKSHMFKHLHSTMTCFDSYNSFSFKITNKANS